MHLDAAILVIDSSHVLELCEIEIGVEFTIDASQQVQVERSGHSQFVVVGVKQLNVGFFEIGAEQE